MIVHGRGAITVRATAAGSLASFAVEPGSTVRRGQRIGTLVAPEGKIPVRAPYTCGARRQDSFTPEICSSQH